MARKVWQPMAVSMLAQLACLPIIRYGFRLPQRRISARILQPMPYRLDVWIDESNGSDVG